ncbi:30S ribosomal protein S8 [candidate division WWE3 bacterium]|nr:30S ribosomal protein S8 [candidate division WWE3 bacterium]
MDTIAQMLTSIKNAGMSGKEFVELPYSSLNEKVLKVIKEKEFIKDFKVFKPSGSPFKMLHIDLKFEDSAPRISEVKRISKLGRRVYKGRRAIKKVLGGYGISIVSTSRGVMEGSEARRRKLGGEVICQIW